MAASSFRQFLQAVRDNPALLARNTRRNLSQILFHSRNDGFDFTAYEVAQVVGLLEANVILTKDQDPFDESARLWREMWGRTHLEYLIQHVVSRYTNEELSLLIDQHEAEINAAREARTQSTPPAPGPLPQMHRNVATFLRKVATQRDILELLKTRSKDEVLATASAFGFPFSEREFDVPIWGLEAHLATIRGELFDAQFPLWETMWGQYYLEYLVIDLIPSFEEVHLDVVMREKRSEDAVMNPQS